MMASWTHLCLATLLVSGALGFWVDEDNSSEDYTFDDYEQDLNGRRYEEYAKTYAPYLRFHKTEGSEGFCFPHNASDYYQARVGGDWSRKCNEDYTSITAGTIPTYWHAMECDDHLHIAYWSFYGYNHDCDCCSGERDAWWEYVVVKVRNFGTSQEHLSEVMFGQKDGWYTRVSSHYELHLDTHPVAYVGRASHGFYHDDGGTGTCCYFEDTRNPGSANMVMKTWDNLVMLSRDVNAEDWMQDTNLDLWNGISVPTQRNDWYLCNLVGCKGSNYWTCWTCGCAKSDIGHDPF